VRPRLKATARLLNTNLDGVRWMSTGVGIDGKVGKVAALSRGQPVKKQRVSKPVFMVVRPTTEIELVLRPKDEGQASFGGLLLGRADEIPCHLV
jgi:hypothetical protein